MRRRLALVAFSRQLQHLLRLKLALAAIMRQFLRRRLALSAFLGQLQQSLRRNQEIGNKCLIVQCSSGTLPAVLSPLQPLPFGQIATTVSNLEACAWTSQA